MSPLNSRAKGRRAEIELAKLLAPHWPGCVRNLDQFGSDKRDMLHTPGVHWQAKHVEKLNMWAALEQALTEAAIHDVPVVAFKRNRSAWFAALELEELIPLLLLREAA